MIDLVSLGLGVQSVTMALMAKHGLITPMPAKAIFADPQRERQATYEYLDFLRSPNVALPFEIERVTIGDLGDEILRATQGLSIRVSHARPPFFVLNPDGSAGQVRRQCTGDYKIDPIHQAIRRTLGLKFRQRWPKTVMVRQWIGISTDEASRMRTSEIPTIENRYPLIELGMSRTDCIAWLTDHDYPVPPKSACIFCPFMSNTAWKDQRDNRPDDHAYSISIDRAIRHGLRGAGLGGELFLHASRTPLETVDFDALVAKDVARAKKRAGTRALAAAQINMFENDCTGMCGT